MTGAYGTSTYGGTYGLVAKSPAVRPNYALRLTVETPSGTSFDLTRAAQGLSYSNVNPGGDEVCTFTLSRSWLAANPELTRLSTVRVSCGLDILWQGRLEDIDRGAADSEEISVAAYGMGVRMKDNDFSVSFVDRSAGSWTAPTLNQRIAIADASDVLDQDYSASADQESLAFEGVAFTPGGGEQVKAGSRALLMYVMPEGLLADEFQYTLREDNITNLRTEHFAATNDDSVIVQNWPQTADLAATVPVASIELTTSSKYLALWMERDTAGKPSSPPKRTFPVFAVYGDHGLDRQDNGAEPDGFVVSQMVAYVVADVDGVVVRTIDGTTFVVDHATYPDPAQTHQDVVEDLDNFEGADWGTWGPSSVFDRSDAGYFDYRRPDRSTQHWLTMRADFEGLDLHTETQTLYDRVKVSFTDQNGTPQVVERSIVVPELQAAGVSRTATLDGGELTTRIAEQLGDAFLRLQGTFAQARGSAEVVRPIRHYRRGLLPPCYLRADGSNIRISDVLPASELVSLDSAPDKKTTFPIKRVQVDASGEIPRATINLDQAADELAVLQSRLDLGRSYTDGARGGAKRSRKKYVGHAVR